MEPGIESLRAGAVRGRRKAILLAATACGSGLLFAVPVQAQTALGEIVVTARKRQESVLNVPVVETVVSSEQIVRAQANDVRDLSRFTPGLSFGFGPANIGTVVSIRGVGTTALDPSVDQSISLHLDGMQFGQGLAYSAALVDVGQVEVLKGPQSLFYGKSSPGGVISVRSADPTDKFEMMVRGGYEFEAEERKGEFMISGPVTDGLKMRLAGMYTKADGFFKNVATGGVLGGVAPKHKRDARESYVFRYTALWDPTDNFSARLKVDVAHDHWFTAATSQLTSCPNGTASFTGIPFVLGDDCRLNRNASAASLNPNTYGGLWYGGEPQLKNNLQFGTLELNYKFSPELTLTSLTGYSWSHGQTMFTPGSTIAGPAIGVQNKLDREEFQQELRLNSDYAGPFNFTAGAFYQDASIYSLSNIPGNTALRLPGTLTMGEVNVDVKTYSGFGQVRYKPTEQWELAGGVRYTDEKRNAHAFDVLARQHIRLAKPEIRSKTWSPELTVSYKPQDNVTLFGSVKRGYKSGSFSMGTALAQGVDLSYGDEKVTGGELGLKSRLLDRRLSIDVAAFYYKYKGLQSGVVRLNPLGISESLIVNAGSATTKGIEWDANYLVPGVDGLTVSFNGMWNKAWYGDLQNITCWDNQTIAAGCNTQLSPLTGRFTTQDLSGTNLPRAPRWQLNGGFDYERPVGGDMTLDFGVKAQYSGKYLAFPADAKVRPDMKQGSWTKLNARIALKGPEDRWEFALIGNNIANKLTAGSCSFASPKDGTLLPSFTPGALLTGSNTVGLSGLAQIQCRVDRGREIWLRATFRPF